MIVFAVVAGAKLPIEKSGSFDCLVPSTLSISCMGCICAILIERKKMHDLSKKDHQRFETKTKQKQNSFKHLIKSSNATEPIQIEPAIIQPHQPPSTIGLASKIVD